MGMAFAPSSSFIGQHWACAACHFLHPHPHGGSATHRHIHASLPHFMHFTTHGAALLGLIAGAFPLLGVLFGTPSCTLSAHIHPTRWHGPWHPSAMHACMGHARVRPPGPQHPSLFGPFGGCLCSSHSAGLGPSHHLVARMPHHRTAPGCRFACILAGVLRPTLGRLRFYSPCTFPFILPHRSFCGLAGVPCGDWRLTFWSLSVPTGPGAFHSVWSRILPVHIPWDLAGQGLAWLPAQGLRGRTHGPIGLHRCAFGQCSFRVFRRRDVLPRSG